MLPNVPISRAVALIPLLVAFYLGLRGDRIPAGDRWDSPVFSKKAGTGMGRRGREKNVVHGFSDSQGKFHNKNTSKGM